MRWRQPWSVSRLVSGSTLLPTMRLVWLSLHGWIHRSVASIVAIKNANDGISMVQTAEGALQEVTDMLQRMRELALQSVQGSNNDEDRAALDAEVQQLKSEIDRISESTSFNAQNILDGTFNRLFQIGDQAGDTIRIGLGSVDTASFGMAATDEASSDPADVLVSARLARVLSWDPS